MAEDHKHCGTCRYFGFKGFERWCRHPDHPARLTTWPCHCPAWLDKEAKSLGGITYPDPIILEQPA